MACRRFSDNTGDYSDCLDHLRQIVSNYSASHTIVLGGDMNADWISRGQSLRAQLLKGFPNDSILDTVYTNRTYRNSDGVLTFTLDYSFYPKDFFFLTKL